MPKNVKLTIGDFSKYCQVTVKALRHYEKLGLLVPNEVDEWTRYRYYDVAQMQQLNGILRLKEMGFSLEEIRSLLDEGTHRPSIPQIEAKTVEVKAQIGRLEQRLEVLQRMGDSMRQIAHMERFSIQRLPPIIVASHRQVIRNYEELRCLCAEVIGPAIQMMGCKRTQPIYAFSINYDSEYKEEYIDVEYCEQVDQMYADSQLIKFKQLPEIPTAVCMKCLGPYNQMQDNFLSVFSYIAKQGYQVAGRHRIQYVEGSWNQKDPEKWVTIIQVPVRKRVAPNTLLPSEAYYQ